MKNKKKLVVLSLIMALGLSEGIVQIKEAPVSVQKQVILPVSYGREQGVTDSGTVVDEYKDSGLTPACNESGEWGYVNEDGEVVVSYQYTEAFGFWENGLAKVRSGEKYGLINELGVVLAQTVYDEMGDFGANGLILVRQGRRYNFLNSFGMCEFETVGEFTEDGAAPAKRDGKYYFIDKRGNRVNDRTYDSVSVMDKGKMYKVRYGTKYGAVNGKGEEVIPAVYDGLYLVEKHEGQTSPWDYLSKELYVIWNGERCGLADASGKMLCDVKYKAITGVDLENQILIVKNEKDVFEYINLEKGVTKKLDGDYAFLQGEAICIRIGHGREAQRVWYDEELNIIGKESEDFNIFPYKDSIVFWQNSQCGVMDYEKNIIAEPIYDLMEYVEEGEYFIVCKNGKYGYYTKDMKEKIPCQFDNAREFSDGIAVVEINGKCGVINEDGQFIAAPIYDELTGIWKAANGFLLVIQNEKYGLIDKNGKKYLDCIYSGMNISGIQDGVIMLRDENRDVWGAMNTDLQMIIPMEYSTISYYKEYNCIGVTDANGIRHYFDTDGNEIFPVYYGASEISKDGLVSVNGGEGFTIYDIGGEAVRYFEYKNVGCFYNGLARVEDWDGSVGFMNENGEKITEFEFSDAWDFSEDGLAAVCKDGKWGFIDEAGNNVAECIYDEVQDFADGRAPVCRNGKWGYIDTLGNEVIPLKYDRAGQFVYDHFYYYYELTEPIYATVTIGSGEDEQSYKINYAGEIIGEIE